MTSMIKLVKQLRQIDKECDRNKKLNAEMEKYVRSVDEPSSKQDAVRFIEHYKKVRKSC